MPKRSAVPAEASRGQSRLQRAGWQARRRVGFVVSARGGVVGRVGVEEGGEDLDLAAADAGLPLAAAIGADAALGAVVVGLAEVAQAADPRGLDVDHLRLPGQRLDVADRVDR